MGSITQREPLSRPAIVVAAIALADEEGVRALTMRNLAGRLGYEVMSLYNHVANKNELLGLMVDAVADEIYQAGEIGQADERDRIGGAGRSGDSLPAPTLAEVRSIGVSMRAALVRHPWAPELWQRHFPGPARTSHMEDLLRTLHRSGLSPELAHHGFHAVNNHVLGYTLQELGMTLDVEDPDDLDAVARQFLAGVDPETRPYTVAHVRQHLDGDSASSFELVLDLILDGLLRLQQTAEHQTVGPARAFEG